LFASVVFPIPDIPRSVIALLGDFMNSLCVVFIVQKFLISRYITIDGFPSYYDNLSGKGYHGQLFMTVIY